MYKRNDNAPDPKWTTGVAKAKAKLDELKKVTTRLNRDERKLWWAAQCVVLAGCFRKSSFNGFVDLLGHMSGAFQASSARHDDTAAQLRDLAKEVGKLRSEIDQVRSVAEAIGRVGDRTAIDLATLKREVDLLEMENSLLKAGRSPVVGTTPDEALPGKFSEWNGRG